MPPPPVDGAPTGTGLDGRAGAGGVLLAGVLLAGLLVAGLGSPELGSPELGADGRAVLLGERLAVAEPVAVAAPLDPGENVGGLADGGDDEQAATEAEASMATAAQEAAASLVLSLALSLVPALTIGTLTGSPHASGRQRDFLRSRCWNGRSTFAE